MLQVREEGPSPTAGPSSEKKRKSKKHGEEPQGKRSKSSGIAATEVEFDDRKKPQPHSKRSVKALESKSEDLNIKAGSSKFARQGPSDADGDDSDDPSNLIHESLRAKGPKTGGKRPKYAPPDEAQEQKDARTIFVGNLPPEVAQTRVSEHYLVHVPLTSPSLSPYRNNCAVIS